MRAAAFCPGHISSIFQVCRHSDAMRTGTRGAGICIDMGATAEVECWPGEGMEILIDGHAARAPVTRGLLEALLPDGLGIRVHISLDLPQEQGFAMSAAGTLAVGTAMGQLLSVPEERVWAAAHRSEVMNGGGLGDVAGILCGGVSIRTRPGLPPHGEWSELGYEPEIVVGIVGPPIPTSDVLADEERVAFVSGVGRRCVDSLSGGSNMDMFMRASRRFAEEAGLITGDVRAALSALDGHRASMVMLGNSVFSIGEADSDMQTMLEFGEAYNVSVDRTGPRLLNP